MNNYLHSIYRVQLFSAPDMTSLNSTTASSSSVNALKLIAIFIVFPSLKVFDDSFKPEKPEVSESMLT